MTTEPERHAARPRRSAARAEHPAAKLESSAVESERFEAGHERSTAAPAHPSAKSEILEGLRLSLAAGLGMYPLGIAFGLLVIQAGLPWWVAPALSTAGYAGSLELLLIGMITSGTALGTIALTTFLVNFRHVFYAFSFPLRAVTGKFTRFYSMYALTDESYAVTAVDPENWTARKLLTVQIAFQCYWVGGGLTGVALGSLISEPIDGLDFALCALFITLTLDAYKNGREVPSMLLAGVAFSIGVILTPNSAIFTSLSAFVALLAVRYAISKVRRTPERKRRKEGDCDDA